jgi:acyl carrier protein
MSVQDKVVGIIVENLGVAADQVTPDKSFEALGADSLAVVELVMALEDEFDIEVEESVASELKTVQSCIDYITELQA